MPHNPVVWFEIYVQDMKRARDFYESVFGGRLAKMESSLPGIELWNFPMERNGAGAPGALIKMDGCPSGGNGTIVYFSCADCAIEAKKAVANGGHIFKDKSSIGQYGFIALVIDTEGNMIGLHSMR